MHIQNSDCTSSTLINNIKQCLSKKEQISCIGPHAIFKVIEALDETMFFTVRFKNFDQMSGIVFSFVNAPELNTNEDEDEVIMKTSSTTNVKSLANAIHKTAMNKKELKLSCIGKSSINQAIKALAIFFKDSQSKLVCVEKKKVDDSAESREIVSFITVNIK